MFSGIPCGSVSVERILKNVAVSAIEQLEFLQKGQSNKIVIIAGPTGVGKTNLSLELAERLHGEIISADSVQVYRRMDIGTAKVSIADRQRVPHHLIDIRDITETFNVVDFYEESRAAIRDIMERGKVPIVVGGTGFYLHSLLYGPPNGPPSDKEVRAKFEGELEKFGVELLYERLISQDPVYAATITKSDGHKIVRALEIMEVSGRAVSSFSWKERKLESFYEFLCYFIHMPRKLLYPQLEQRCEAMLQQGLLEEVVLLDRMGLRDNATARQAIGYKQSLEYLKMGQNPEDYEQFVADFKTASRHLAKRQFTWFKNTDKSFQWVDLTELSREAIIEMILRDYRSYGTNTSLAVD